MGLQRSQPMKRMQIKESKRSKRLRRLRERTEMLQAKNKLSEQKIINTKNRLEEDFFNNDL